MSKQTNGYVQCYCNRSRYTFKLNECWISFLFFSSYKFVNLIYFFSVHHLFTSYINLCKNHWNFRVYLFDCLADALYLSWFFLVFLSFLSFRFQSYTESFRKQFLSIWHLKIYNKTIDEYSGHLFHIFIFANLPQKSSKICIARCFVKFQIATILNEHLKFIW